MYKIVQIKDGKEMEYVSDIGNVLFSQRQMKRIKATQEKKGFEIIPIEIIATEEEENESE